MTEPEFKDELLPVLSGLWPRMVAKTRPSSTEFDVKAAKEANHHIFAVLGRFELKQVIQASRDYAYENPVSPSYGDYGKVLTSIKAKILGDKTTNRINEDAHKRMEARIQEAREAYEGSAGWEYPGDEFVRKCIIEGRLLPLQHHRLTVDYPECRRILAAAIAKRGGNLTEVTERDKAEEKTAEGDDFLW